MHDFPIIDIDHFSGQEALNKVDFLYSELQGPHYIDKPHQHFFFLLILFDKANGEHTIDFNTYKISDKQIHILFPNQVHSWTIKDSTQAYQLMIDKVYFEKLSLHFRHAFAYYYQNPIINLSNLVFNQLVYEFKSIKQELLDNNTLIDLIESRIAVIASLLSKEIDKTTSNKTQSSYSVRLFEFQELIEQFYCEEKSIEFYAQRLNISSSQLSKLTRKHLSISPMQLIYQRRVLQAKRLLKSTDLSIKEIAFQLGFIDAPYFTNFFKKHTNLSPSEFRSE
ncbi:AraC-type DNA-binding protein [Myroides marinus]|uniref:AraC-type DNA-binding protein n=1 Tax=Myroides marinus TaxID=703342 RepID=A0A1H6XYY9_9FLAO|nr:AraC family transcriptional regulator [Myroides marinus]SEJ32834.1 AraC-type DNA-binding protein [Myroides marinus]